MSFLLFKFLLRDLLNGLCPPKLRQQHSAESFGMPNFNCILAINRYKLALITLCTVLFVPISHVLMWHHTSLTSHHSKSWLVMVGWTCGRWGYFNSPRDITRFTALCYKPPNLPLYPQMFAVHFRYLRCTSSQAKRLWSWFRTHATTY